MPAHAAPHAAPATTLWSDGQATRSAANDAGSLANPPGAFITLDATNERIVQLVAHDGRLSIEEIAHAVGRSASTVRDRLATLEARGIVLGYQARVDWSAAGLPYLAVFDADCPAEEADPVAQRLGVIPGVVQAVVTTGRPNVLVMARAASVQGINRVRGHLAAAGLSSIGMRLAIKPLVRDRPPVESADGGRAADRDAGTGTGA